MPKAHASATRAAPAASATDSATGSRTNGGIMKHWLWLSLAVLVLDQATKWLVLGLLEPFEVIELVPNLNLTLMFNTGAAFSLLADAGGWQRWLFALVAVGITVALTVWLLRLKSGDGSLAFGLALLIGGAVGNLIDRILLGHVVDFIQVYLPFIPLAVFNPWPSFNIADSAISVGVVVMLIATLRESEPT
ncbi:Lipoprotein signal peptidase [Thiocapsa marina 5811]|uniref:Lipoprotein signal peptidase n=2 Tax=Thiocapsa marina TaxID=244573 RepID=F9UBD8_9GAMM|nr:Lipoprotein signal peptidase [Thiocapsa marina 5811]